MSSDPSENNRLVDKSSEMREDTLRFRELTPALRIYEKNLHLRLDQLERQLQANMAAIQSLETRLVQELSAIKEAQTADSETLNNVNKFIRRGVWWRRLRAIVSWLLLLAMIAIALYAYFFFDWHSLIPPFF